jgi:hypothetical protein
MLCGMPWIALDVLTYTILPTSRQRGMLNTNHLLEVEVLCNVPVRDTLLWLSRTGFFGVRWSPAIIEEAKDWFLRANPLADVSQLQRMIDKMREAFKGADVLLIDDQLDRLNDERLIDFRVRHVLAAAMAGNVHSLITTDVATFPPSICSLYGITIETPDQLASRCLMDDCDLVLETLFSQADECDSSLTDLLKKNRNHMPQFYSGVARYIKGLPPIGPTVASDAT